MRFSFGLLKRTYGGLFRRPRPDVELVTFGQKSGKRKKLSWLVRAPDGLFFHSLLVFGHRFGALAFVVEGMRFDGLKLTPPEPRGSAISSAGESNDEKTLGKLPKDGSFG